MVEEKKLETPKKIYVEQQDGNSVMYAFEFSLDYF